ncbi:hypothetical protein BC941DRAFT_15102 [Chlamydoabsidia padenii]|nr:hypothetical protein BC941DRAFT_15102 [Chlamydoabsidia padenii]
MFPCQHAFHAECMIQRITKFLPPRTLRRLAQLEDALNPSTPTTAATVNSNGMMIGPTSKWMSAAAGVIFSGDTTTTTTTNNATTIDTTSNTTTMAATREQLEEELDDIVAKECVLCGDTMIKSIDQPFLNDEETDIVNEWAI